MLPSAMENEDIYWIERAWVKFLGENEHEAREERRREKKRRK